MMTRRRQTSSFKDGRKASPGLLVVISIGVAVLILSGAAVVFAASYSIDTVQKSSGVFAHIEINGNDIVISILGGERAGDLDHVVLVLEGYTLPPGTSSRHISGTGDTVVYPDMAHGLTGTRKIGVRGVFKDGTSMLIVNQEVRFS